MGEYQYIHNKKLIQWLAIQKKKKNRASELNDTSHREKE